jgi:uncharacterized membrane protein YcaP (DUF421 family)
MDLFFRALFVFFFIYFLTRITGRRELATMQPFDLILLVIVGDALQQSLTQDDYSVTGGVIVITTIALLGVGVSWVSFRFKRLRPVLEGEPLIVIERGRVIEKNLKRERMTREELLAQLRLREVASVDDVEWAVLETNGSVTVIPKS